MPFTHVRTGKPKHSHETVAEAKACEAEIGFPQVLPPDPIRDPSVPGGWRSARHQDPCRCTNYDMCWEFRVTSGNRFTAFND